MQEESNNLLPGVARPIHYDLTIVPNLSTKQYSGTVIITLELKQSTQSIKLHQKGLDIQTNSLVTIGDKSLQASGTNEDNKEETLTLRFAEDLPKVDSATLTINFTGTLSKEMSGLYRTTYLDDHGKRHSTITTHLEPTAARKMFPCFDEPKSKATFSITCVAEARFHVLSNMPPDTEDNIMPNVYPPMRQWRFQKTPLMSTYLLALTMGEWDRVERKTKNGALVRVWAPLKCASQAEFASAWAVKCLDFFDSYFACPYVLPKLDLVPVENFPIGGMENWGCIMFAKRLLLVTPDTTAAIQASIKMIIAHELAHMWFGNLVTPRFWTSTWLKEGFATYFAYFAGSQLEPQGAWQSMYLEEEIIPGKALDSLASTHALEVDAIKNSGEAREVFDNISYCKGASMVSMLESYIGADAIREGLQDYVAKHQFKNASSLDLWLSLGKASKVQGPSIKDLMKDWVRAEGFPLISVERVASDRIRLTQSRCMLVKPVAGSKAATTAATWTTPLRIISSSNSKEELVVVQGPSVDVVVDSSASWVLVNSRQRGFVRVHYQTPELQNAILQNFASLSDVDRLGLLDDQANLVKSGKVPLADFLAFLKGPLASHEKTPSVWKGVCKFWTWADKLWGEESRFQKWGTDLFVPLLKSLGVSENPAEDSEVTQLRAMVLSCVLLCTPSEVIDAAKKMVGKHATVNSLLSVSKNLRGVIWSALVQSDNKKAYAALCEMVLEGRQDDIVVQQALKALQRSPNPNAVDAHFGMALPSSSSEGNVTSSKIKGEMLPHLVRGAVDASPRSREAALAYVTGPHWKDLVVAGGGAAACAERLIAPFSGLCTESHIMRLKSWANSLEPETKSFVTKTVAQISEEVMSNLSVRAAGIATLKSMK